MFLFWRLSLDESIAKPTTSKDASSGSSASANVEPDTVNIPTSNQNHLDSNEISKCAYSNPNEKVNTEAPTQNITPSTESATNQDDTIIEGEFIPKFTELQRKQLDEQLRNVCIY